MEKVTLFGKDKCVLCEGWGFRLKMLKIPFTYHDVGTVDGLVEMAWNNVARVPALIIGEKTFEEIDPKDMETEELKTLVNGG